MTDTPTFMLINGKVRAARLRQETAFKVSHFKRLTGLAPGLAVIIVGDDPASHVYVRSKIEQTTEVGMVSFHYQLPDTTPQDQLLELVNQLNNTPNIHGILVQLPLPAHMDNQKILAAINPSKDVDGFHIVNAGLLATGGKGLVPCTPLGCLLMITERFGNDLSGLNAVIIGRSNIVGKPMAQLLLSHNATVTICHSRTKDLPQITKTADILVAAVGCPEMVKADWVKPGATVIDVGMNRVPAPEKGAGKFRLTGDVDFPHVAPLCSAITPVPGGVGPMTIAMLLSNTLIAACTAHNIDPSALKD